MPFLQLRDSRYPLRLGDNRVGWGPEVEVRLPEQTGDIQPRSMAVVSIAGSGSASVSTKSAPADVALNGVPVGGPAPVLHGDRLALGNVELRFGDESQLGETVEIDFGDDFAIAVPSALARSSRSEGRLLSLVDGREYAIGPMGLSIGRDPSCDLVVATADVSRRHATIRPASGGYLLLDTSANGVFVNNARVQAELSLGRGDTLRVGSGEFRFYAEQAAPEEDIQHPGLQNTGMFEAATPSQAAAGAAANSASRPVAGYLEIINEGPTKGVRFPLDSPRIAVGRGSHNDLVINDDSVSEQHAKLQRREDAWYLIDLDSTNGTYLSGSRVTDEVKLSSGSDVRFGGVKMIFRVAGSAPRPSGETRVIVGVKGPDPKRAEQRLKELVDQARAEGRRPLSVSSSLIWVIVIVLVILAIYSVVRDGGL